MPVNPNEDDAIAATLDLMKAVPCCEIGERGCYHRHGQCDCSCPQCLCAYVAFQIEQEDALVSFFLPKLGYAVIVEILAAVKSVEGGGILALIAPGRVWFPATTTGWLSISDSGLGWLPEFPLC
jgi:hypothetical protein